MAQVVTTFDLNAKSLSQEMGEDVPDVFCVVAKHQAAGFSSESICEVLSCEPQELQEVLEDALYQRVKGYVAGIAASQAVNQSTGWDALEDTALRNLHERLKFEKDAEFLLKVAAVANRATRKVSQTSNVLDPGLRAGRTTITLTQRLISKINGKGEQSQTEERQLSIRDGSMTNPTFGEIDSLLNVKTTPILPTVKAISTHDATIEDLVDDFMRR